MAANFRFLGQTPVKNRPSIEITAAFVQEVVLEPLDTKAIAPVRNMHNFLKSPKDEKALSCLKAVQDKIVAVLNSATMNQQNDEVIGQASVSPKH